jgi:hypothetical protein
MNRSLEKLAGEEQSLGEDSEDDDGYEPRSFLEFLWISCTPIVLCQWLFHRQNPGSSGESDIGDGKGGTGERISLSRFAVANDGLSERRDSGDGMLPEPKAGGGLKVMRSEIDRTSGESSDCRSHADEIRRLG